MKRSAFYRMVACFVIVAIAGTAGNAGNAIAGFAGEPAREAFLRGGTAITEALAAKTVAPSLVSAELLPSARVVPPAQQPASVQSAPSEGKRRTLMLWIGIGVTGAIASYLIWRGVKDHGHVFEGN